MLDAELKTLKRRKYLEYVCEKCKYVTFRIDAESKTNSACIAEDLFDKMEPWLISSLRNKEYLGAIFGKKCYIYVNEMNDIFKEFLLKHKAIRKWRYPDYPEDPCFFTADKKCFMEISVHENHCFIYDDSEENIKMLRKNWVSFGKRIKELEWDSPNFPE